MMPKKTTIQGIVLVLTVFGTMALFGSRSDRISDTSLIAFPVVERDLQRSIEEIGTLEPETIAVLHAPFRGTITSVIEDGVLVKTGDVLFQFDATDEIDRITGNRENITNNQEALQEKQGILQELTNTYASVSALEQAEWEHAKLELELAMEGLSADERELLDLQIRQAEIDVEDTKEQLNRQKELVERGFASPLSLDQLNRSYESARAYLREQKTRREISLQPIPDERRLTLEANVQKTGAIVERSKARHLREVERHEIAIEGLHLQIEHMQKQIDRREERIRHSEVRSPTNGLVRLMRYIDWNSDGWQTITTGLEFHTKDILGNIVDPRNMWVETLIHESEILSIDTNTSVSVTLTPYPDKPFQGQIIELTALGKDRADLTPVHRRATPAYQAYFRAKVRFQSGTLPIKAGMTAKVRFQLEERTRALTIPSECVTESANHTFSVTMLNGETRRVSGHQRDDGWFVISEGLEKGERVVLPSTSGSLL